jgi:hypothetical protein
MSEREPEYDPEIAEAVGAAYLQWVDYLLTLPRNVQVLQKIKQTSPSPIQRERSDAKASGNLFNSPLSSQKEE